MEIEMRVVPADVPNAYHIAIYSDELVIKTMANRRTLDGVMHPGAYKSIHIKSVCNVWQVLLYTLRSLRKSNVDYIFIYSNDKELEGLRLGTVKSKRDTLAQLKSATMCELYQYAQRGGWYYTNVSADKIPATRDMHEANR